MRKIIAFAGSKQAGKTTAFRIAKNTFQNVCEVTIAGKLKRVVGEVLGIDEKHFRINELKEVPLEDPINLTSEHVEAVLSAFGLVYQFDIHVRPHIGTVIETPRQALQFLGTEVLHPIDNLVHVKHAVADMPESGIMVITDLRFLQEFNYFKEKHTNEFYPFYIKNNRAEAVAAGDKHPSETDLRKFRYRCTLIDNNHSLEQYEKSLIKKLGEVL